MTVERVALFKILHCLGLTPPLLFLTPSAPRCLAPSVSIPPTCDPPCHAMQQVDALVLRAPDLLQFGHVLNWEPSSQTLQGGALA